MTDARPRWFRNRETLRYRLTHHLSRATRGYIKSPFYHSAVAYHQAREAEELAEDRISADHCVEMLAVWTVEFFTPANVEKLYRALDNLKPVGSIGHRDPAGWIRRQRSRPGSSYNFHFVPEGARAWGTGYRMQMPTFAKGAASTILCCTPSLTLLTTHFELTDSNRIQLDEQLHQDYPTKVILNKDGSLNIMSPHLQHRRLVEDHRRRWIGEVTEWHKEFFPGLLSSNGESVMSCELSSLSGLDPFPTDISRSKLLDALGLSFGHDVFKYPSSDDSAILHLNMYGDDSISEEMFFLSANQEKIRLIATDGDGSDDEGIAHRIDSTFRTTFSTIALSGALRYYSRQANKARDDAAAIVGSTKATEALARVRRDVAQCLDAATIARELKAGVEAGWIDRHGMPFHLRRAGNDDTPISLRNASNEVLLNNAEELIENVKELNAGLDVQANLLSAHANLKLQPWIILLAVISMIAGLIAAIDPAQKLLNGMSPFAELAADYVIR